MGRVMSATPTDLIDIAVDDLREEDLRDAFKAHFKRVEEIRATTKPHCVAIEKIAQRLGQGQLIGECRDCERPIFHKDNYLYYSATNSFACAPACAAPAIVVGVDLASGTDLHTEVKIKDGKVVSFKHRFALVRK